MKTVKCMLASVIALTLATTLTIPAALGDNTGAGDIVRAVEADLRATDGGELGTDELDIDELVAADKTAADKPLALRQSQPMAFAEEQSTSSLWWKLLISCAIVVGALWLLKRRLKPSAASKPPVLDVISRKSVGVRSEICIVRVDGHRLLLGITPNSIQRLAALPDPDEGGMLSELEVAAPESGPAEVEPGFGALLSGTYARLAQAAEDRRVARSVTLSPSELASAPPPASSRPRVIVRDTPSPSSRQLELSEKAGAQAHSLRAGMLRKKAS